MTLQLPLRRAPLYARLAVVAVFFLAAQAATAGDIGKTLPASETGGTTVRMETEEDRLVREIGKQLRCAVCQNEPVSDSNSALAQNMRSLIREQLRKGQSREEVMEYFVSRYGDYVLMEPRRSGINWVLWGTPFLALLGGLVALFVRTRRRDGDGATARADSAANDTDSPGQAPGATTTSDDLIRNLRGERKRNDDS